MNPPRVLLLDLDGTLADSLGVVRRVYEEFVLDHGGTPSQAEFESLNGPPLAEVLRRLKAIHGLPGSERELLARYEALLDRIYLEVAPNPGAGELLARARHAGCLTGVVTSNSAARTRAWLERSGLAPAIDALVASDDVRVGKPDPEPYLLALQRCNCAAVAGVAVEDSGQGARAAMAAGLRTFLLASAHAPAAAPEGVERVAGLAMVAERLWS